MKKEEFKKGLEMQFVDDYDSINKYMSNINIVLINNNLEPYKYNEFCIDMEENIFNLYKNDNYEFLSPDEMTEILNEMIINKIKEEIK